MTELTLDQTTVIAFANNMKLRPQQEASILVPHVMADLNVSQPGIFFTSEYQDRSDPQARSGRAPKSPEGFVGEGRRVGTYDAEHDGKFIDEQDKLNKLADPTSGAMRAMIAGKERSRDRKIMSVLQGPAREGNSGEVSTPFPVSRIIGVQENAFYRGKADGAAAPGAANLPLTPAKLRRAKSLLAKSFIKGKRKLIVSEDDIQNMLTSIETTSVDFTAVKALVNGEITNWMGFDFLILPDDYFTVPAANQRRLIAYLDTAVSYKSTDIETATLSKRADRSYTPYAYYAFRHGGLREFDEGVVLIDVMA
jgi:hypothetical protein